MWAVSIVIALFVAASVQGTPCGNSYTCKKTKLVSGQCENNVCTCADGAVPTYTGCGERAAIEALTPKVSTGVFSGQAIVGVTVDLTCESQYSGTNTVTYNWFKEDAPIVGANSASYSYVALEGPASFSCEIVDEPVFRAKSVPFVVTGYTAIVNMEKPVVVYNVPVGYTVTKNVRITATCANRPNVPLGSMSIVWNDRNSQISPQISWLNLEVAAKDPGLTCTISGVTGQTAGQGMSDPAQLPQLEERTVGMILNTASTVVTDGNTETAIRKCTLDPSNVFIGSTPQVSGLTCTASTGDVTDSDSSSIKTNNDQGARVVASTGSPVVSGDLTLTCYVTLPVAGALEFTWYHDDVLIPGQSDQVLQMNNLDTDYSGRYKCLVKQAGQPAVSTSTRIDFGTTRLGIAAVPPTSVFSTGLQYQLECRSTPEPAGITYQWINNGNVMQGQTDKILTVTATATENQYRCRASYGTPAQILTSDVFSVQGRDILSVKLEDRSWTEPVVGGTISYRCVVETRTGFTGTLVYQWTSSVAAGTVQSGDTYTLSGSQLVANTAQTLNCRVTVQGSTETVVATPIAITVRAAPFSPTIIRTSDTMYTQNDYTWLYAGGNAEMTCRSGSDQAGAVYEWTRDGIPLAETSKVITLSNIDSSAMGTYRCSITVQGKKSPPSSGVKLLVSNKSGKYCSILKACETGGYYTGHCFDNRCDCTDNGKPAPNACVERTEDDKDSASVLGLSLVTLLTSFLVTKLA